MSSGVPTLSEIIRNLPPKIQARFISLGSYVDGLIRELKIELRIDMEFSRDDMQIIQFAAFIYALDQFMRIGTVAAQNAATTFQTFDQQGFRVGARTFTKDNMETMRGERLANELRKSVAKTPLVLQPHLAGMTPNSP